MIRSKMYEIRGQKVMLDFDLAAMYGVITFFDVFSVIMPLCKSQELLIFPTLTAKSCYIFKLLLPLLHER